MKKRSRRSVPNRKDMIAALGLPPEGKKRHEKYAYSTAEYWRDIQRRSSSAHDEARRTLGIPKKS